ncbi:hypothetical protein, partial [Promicromonospora kroppenstedtii]|uniref:hypothetical protein n=1 Tax=Promicromonospora kroppenstedtii TaxID=440482 RepID=UPI00056CA4D7
MVDGRDERVAGLLDAFDEDLRERLDDGADVAASQTSTRVSISHSAAVGAARMTSPDSSSALVYVTTSAPPR